MIRRPPRSTQGYSSAASDVYKRQSFGKLVRIDHGNGLQTYYAHNSQLLVSAGDHVAQGEVIAKAGATGRVTGPHVHFEVRVNGQRRNPINYLP